MPITAITVDLFKGKRILDMNTCYNKPNMSYVFAELVCCYSMKNINFSTSCSDIKSPHLYKVLQRLVQQKVGKNVHKHICKKLLNTTYSRNSMYIVHFDSDLVGIVVNTGTNIAISNQRRNFHIFNKTVQTTVHEMGSKRTPKWEDH